MNDMISVCLFPQIFLPLPLHDKLTNKTMRISKNKFVAVTYDLNVGEGSERELMERATKENPLKFIFGTGMMLKDFEDHLSGLAGGDTFDFSLTPEQAYGERNEDHVMELPKHIFEIDGKFDSEHIKEGETVPMMSSDGNRMNGSVLEVKDDIVVMDFNHPLAGEMLHFSGEVVDVHDPTEEEITELNRLMSGGCGGCCDCGDDACGCGDDACGGHEHGNGDCCGGGCHCG